MLIIMKSLTTRLEKQGRRKNNMNKIDQEAYDLEKKIETDWEKII